MKRQCFNLPKDNLHVLRSQEVLEGEDCDFEEEDGGLKAYENENVQ